MSVSAYRRAVAETEGPRETERRLMAEITAQLIAYQEQFDTAEKPQDKIELLSSVLREALAKNAKLWGALRLDLVSPENQLPKKLRADLISLSLFIDRQTQTVLGGNGQIAPLIAVNRSIMDGLSGKAPEAA